MGWNSWDCFGGSVTEAEVVDNAEYMAEHLLAFGWDTIVIDIQWYEPNPGLTAYDGDPSPVLDAGGRQLAAPNRFPSAAGGSWEPLADRIHALGLRFGLHIMRGIPRAAVARRLPIIGADGNATGLTAADIADVHSICSWNPDNYGIDHTVPGAQQYYDGQVAQLASWGVDLIKLDDVLYPPVESAEIEAYSRAIDRSGRPIVLSLSPGRRLSLEHARLLSASSQMWRISDDLWDDWAQVVEQFQRAARWAPFQRPGAWADADMLPLGRIGIRAHVGGDRISRLTPAEQQTMITLWTMFRSPLFFGGHLPDTPPETLALLTNLDALSLLREGSGARELVRDGSLVIWSARHGDDEVRAVFWLGDHSETLSLHLADLGCIGLTDVRDLWRALDVPVDAGALQVSIEPHGCRLLRFSVPL